MWDHRDNSGVDLLLPLCLEAESASVLHTLKWQIQEFLGNSPIFTFHLTIKKLRLEMHVHPIGFFFFNVHFVSQLRLSWRLVWLMVLSTEPSAQLLQWVLFVCFIKTLTFPQLSEQFFSLFMCVMHFEHFYVLMYKYYILVSSSLQTLFLFNIYFFLKLLCSLFWSYVFPPPNPLRFSPPPYPPSFVFFSLNNLKKITKLTLILSKLNISEVYNNQCGVALTNDTQAKGAK